MEREQLTEVSTAKIVTWLEKHVGGRVVQIARQPRWRPVWFADVLRDGETLELCVRGDRTDMPYGLMRYIISYRISYRITIRNSGSVEILQSEYSLL